MVDIVHISLPPLACNEQILITALLEGVMWYLT